MIDKSQEQLEMFDKYLSNRSEHSHTDKNKIRLFNKEFDKRGFIIWIIVFIVVNLLSFSFGVEKGLRLAKVKKESISAPSAEVIRKNPKKDTSGLKEDRAIKRIEAPNPEPADITEHKKYSVQVASYRTMTKAEQEAESLRKKGYNSFVLRKGSYVIVCVGKFKEKSEARTSLSKLRKVYSDSYVRRL